MRGADGKAHGELVLFSDLRPEYAREVYVLRLASAGILPAGEYVFLEYYCADPDCDCREARLKVIGRAWRTHLLRVLATVRCPLRSPSDAGFVSGVARNRRPWLEEGPQSEWAPAVLQTIEAALADDDFTNRLWAHYTLVKGIAGTSPSGAPRPSSAVWTRSRGGGGAGWPASCIPARPTRPRLVVPPPCPAPPVSSA